MHTHIYPGHVQRRGGLPGVHDAERREAPLHVHGLHRGGRHGVAPADDGGADQVLLGPGLGGELPGPEGHRESCAFHALCLMGTFRGPLFRGPLIISLYVLA